MRWQIEFIEEGSFVRVTTYDHFNLADYRLMVSEILSQPFWTPGADALFDHRQLEFTDISRRQIEHAASVHREHDEQIGNGLAAIIVKNPADFGLGSMFRESAEQMVAANLCFFLDEQKALDWMAAQGAS